MDFWELKNAIQTPCDKAAFITTWLYFNREGLMPEPVVRVVLNNPRVNNGTWVGDEDGFGLLIAGSFTKAPEKHCMEGTAYATSGAWRIADGSALVKGWCDYNANDENHAEWHVHVDGKTRVPLYAGYERVMSWLGTGFSAPFRGLLESHKGKLTELWSFQGHQLNG
jgi:hypothetical protein